MVFFHHHFRHPGRAQPARLGQGASVVLILTPSVIWHPTPATLFSHGRMQAYRRAKKAINRVTGGLLTMPGLHMLLTK
jgi:threonine/homoserine/homoserine lactone efflux protein